MLVTLFTVSKVAVIAAKIWVGVKIYKTQSTRKGEESFNQQF